MKLETILIGKKWNGMYIWIILSKILKNIRKILFKKKEKEQQGNEEKKDNSELLTNRINNNNDLPRENEDEKQILMAKHYKTRCIEATKKEDYEKIITLKEALKGLDNNISHKIHSSTSNNKTYWVTF